MQTENRDVRFTFSGLAEFEILKCPVLKVP